MDDGGGGGRAASPALLLGSSPGAAHAHAHALALALERDCNSNAAGSFASESASLPDADFVQECQDYQWFLDYGTLPAMCCGDLQAACEPGGEMFASVSGSLLARLEMDASSAGSPPSCGSQGDDSAGSTDTMSLCKSELLFSPVKDCPLPGSNFSVDSLDCDLLTEHDIMLTCQANKDNYTIAFEGSISTPAAPLRRAGAAQAGRASPAAVAASACALRLGAGRARAPRPSMRLRLRLHHVEQLQKRSATRSWRRARGGGGGGRRDGRPGAATPTPTRRPQPGGSPGRGALKKPKDAAQPVRAAAAACCCDRCPAASARRRRRRRRHVPSAEWTRAARPPPSSCRRAAVVRACCSETNSFVDGGACSTAQRPAPSGGRAAGVPGAARPPQQHFSPRQALS
ncbi:Uncharacterized protein GBIM_12135 [Gryllus bimaculatus]|nr:Uncharacterized protein GBIM_12135 [Gryllus bimaculatus]